MRTVALRYALAPACVLLGVVLYFSPAGSVLPTGGLFVLATVGAAWFGGAGPGLLAAALGAVALPLLGVGTVTVLGGFLDLPRFIVFSVLGLSIGWWSLRRRKTEAALRESERRHSLALEASEEGHFEIDHVRDEIFASERFNEIYGLPPGTRLKTNAGYMTHIRFYRPEDAEHFHASLAATFAKDGPERYEFEYRIVLPSGEMRWIRTRGKVMRDADGRPLRRHGMVADVTDAKLALDELRESEVRFRGLTELSVDWYWRQDENLRFTYTSQQVADAESYPREWVIGKARWELPGITPVSFTWAEHQAALKARWPFRDLEYSRTGRNGRTEYVSISGAPIFDERGEFRGYQGIGRNITERKRAEEALRSSEQRYALAMEAAGDGHTDWDLVTGEFYLSPRLLEIVGHSPGATFADRADWVRHFPFHPEDRPKWEAAVAEHHARRESHFKMELRIVVRGEVRWTSFHFLSTRDADGKAIRWTGSIGDITEQKRVEEALRASEERISLAMEASEEGYIDCDVRTDRFIVSERMREIFEVPPGTRIAYRSDFNQQFSFYSEADAKIYGDAIRTVSAQGGPDRYEFEFRAVLPSGKVKWIWTRSKVTRDAEGHAIRRVGVVADVSARKLAEEALRQSEERYERVVAATEAGFWDWDVAQDRYYVSPRLLEMADLPVDTVIGGREDFQARVPLHPEDLARWQGQIRELFASGDSRLTTELRVMLPAATKWVRLDGMCFRDAAGKVLRWTGSAIDVTEAKVAEEALRKSEQRYELAMAASESGYWDWDVLTGRYFVSPRAYELAGFPRGTSWATRDDYRAQINMHPEDLARWEAERRALFEGTGERLAMEVRYMINGEPRWHWLNAICKRDDGGKVIRWTGSATDITERKVAEQGLEAMERKLRQAQRLEAMGTLAGGIAHDFNNILGAILGYGEMAQRDAPKGSRLARDLDSIMVAGERGRALVDRVLAFSRSAVGERVPVHVERVVREALDLIMAKLPPSVTVRAKLHAGAAAVLGDATQVHQVVANLATNAVQAMPAGGTLRVELAIERAAAPRAASIGGIAAGEYVVLTVADTGSGIASEILDRIFDPFFTTKEVGTGTGLGLSLVHGIVTELEGGIDVSSKVGFGSTFTVYLPRRGDASEVRDEEASALPRGDGQRVLVVDDEELLVQLATRTLEDLGYAPVGFTSSTAALAAFRAEPQRFDALVTDERMPEMSGSAMIREVRGMRSSLPIVLMSGFLGGTPGDADEVLQKPLAARDLAASLARVLRSQSVSRSSPARSGKRRPARLPRR